MVAMRVGLSPSVLRPRPLVFGWRLWACAIRAAYRRHGSCRQFFINHLGNFAYRHFVEIARQDAGPAKFGLGYRVFGRRLFYYRVPLDNIESVEWHLSDADDSYVALWIHDEEPEQGARNRANRYRDEDYHTVAMPAGKKETQEFLLALVEFLRNGGAMLAPWGKTTARTCE